MGRGRWVIAVRGWRFFPFGCFYAARLAPVACLARPLPCLLQPLPCSSCPLAAGPLAVAPRSPVAPLAPCPCPGALSLEHGITETCVSVFLCFCGRSGGSPCRARRPGLGLVLSCPPCGAVGWPWAVPGRAAPAACPGGLAACFGGLLRPSLGRLWHLSRRCLVRPGARGRGGPLRPRPWPGFLAAGGGQDGCGEGAGAGPWGGAALCAVLRPWEGRGGGVKFSG